MLSATLSFLAFIVLTIAGLVLVSVVRCRKEEARYRVAGKTCLASAYTATVPCPSLEVTWGYGHPHFKVQFPSIQLREAAWSNGDNDRFVKGIADLCIGRHYGNGGFSADRAILFEYLGEFVWHDVGGTQHS